MISSVFLFSLARDTLMYSDAAHAYVGRERSGIIFQELFLSGSKERGRFSIRRFVSPKSHFLRRTIHRTSTIHANCKVLAYLSPANRARDVFVSRDKVELRNNFQITTGLELLAYRSQRFHIVHLIPQKGTGRKAERTPLQDAL